MSKIMLLTYPSACSIHARNAVQGVAHVGSAAGKEYSVNGTKVDKAQDITEVSEEVGALPPKQELALRAVISHPTLKEAALAAGISETTLWRYMQDAEFSRRLREARREAVSHTVTRLQQASSDAVTVLRDLMLKEDAPPAARISAARTVLDYSFRAAEQEEQRARIDELEQFILRRQEEEALDRGRMASRDEEEGDEDGGGQ
jgi:hypothetical protein